MDLIISVKEINGNCPVYEVGDSFKLIEGYKLVAVKPLCMHALTSLMPHYNALQVSGTKTLGIGRQRRQK